MRWLVALSLALSPANMPAAAQLSQNIDFSDSSEAVTLVHDGAKLSLRPFHDPELDDLIDIQVTIDIPDFPSLTINEGGATSKYFRRWIGIGKLAPSDAAPSVVIEGYTGGAHCCATLRVVTPVGDNLRLVEFEVIDGSGMEIFPTDIDGDARVDFLRQDDRFRYQFSSGAGSLSPPVIFNVIDGNLVNVSKDPRFRSVWTQFAAEARAVCADMSQADRNGACAAYVAARARLGSFGPAMREAESLAAKGKHLDLPTACRVPTVDGNCPARMERKFLTFGEALRWFLKNTGYAG